jgi:hypothetical protein
MKPASPVIPGVDPARELVYAKDQPQYLPLPTHKTPDGRVLSRWELSEEEVQQIVHTRSIYLTLLTFDQPLQPIILGVDPPASFDYLAYAENSLPRAGEAEKPEGCTCDFPEVVYHNLNGHHPACPVWIAWAQGAYRTGG